MAAPYSEDMRQKAIAAVKRGEELGAIGGRNADAFVAFSYLPDTLAITEQAQLLKFNPKVFYVGVGTAFTSAAKPGSASCAAYRRRPWSRKSTSDRSRGCVPPARSTPGR